MPLTCSPISEIPSIIKTILKGNKIIKKKLLQTDYRIKASTRSLPKPTPTLLVLSLLSLTWRLPATSGMISARSSRLRFFATPTGAVSQHSMASEKYKGQVCSALDYGFRVLQYGGTPYSTINSLRTTAIIWFIHRSVSKYSRCAYQPPFMTILDNKNYGTRFSQNLRRPTFIPFCNGLSNPINIR